MQIGYENIVCSTFLGIGPLLFRPGSPRWVSVIDLLHKWGKTTHVECSESRVAVVGVPLGRERGRENGKKMGRGWPDSPLKNALVAFFNLAKLRAKLLAARKITLSSPLGDPWGSQASFILGSPPCDHTAR